MSSESQFKAAIAKDGLLDPKLFGQDDKLLPDFIDAIGTAAYHAGLGWPYATLKALQSMNYYVELGEEQYQIKTIQRIASSTARRGMNSTPTFGVNTKKRYNGDE